MSKPFTIDQIKHSLYYSTIFPNFKKYMRPEIRFDFYTVLNLTRVAIFGDGFLHYSFDHTTIYFELESGKGSYFWNKSEEEDVLSSIFSNKKSTYAEFIDALSTYYKSIKDSPAHYKNSEDIEST